MRQEQWIIDRLSERTGIKPGIVAGLLYSALFFGSLALLAAGKHLNYF